MKNKNFFYITLFAVEFSLLLAAFFVVFFKKIPFYSLFASLSPLYLQSITGLLTGAAAAALITYLVVKLPVFSEIRGIIVSLIKNFNLKVYDLVLIAVLSGVCEETLFRGVIQPVLGIWLTSFIFIFLHGYFNPFSAKITLFGIIMFFISSAMGGLYKHLGLFSAVSFHFSYNLTALFIMWFHIKKQPPDNPQ